jgi:hypothetical protein
MRNDSSRSAAAEVSNIGALATVSCPGKMPVPQLTLFDPAERLLADDERGRITYVPGFPAGR